MAEIDRFLDTSVLVAAADEAHLHHARSAALVLRCQPHSAGCAAHSLAEFTSVITRLPAPYRVEPSAALLMLGDIRARLSVTALTAQEHVLALERWLEHGISGGNLYDALLASCALKAGAGTIFTWNLRHFERLGPEVASRLRQP